MEKTNEKKEEELLIKLVRKIENIPKEDWEEIKPQEPCRYNVYTTNLDKNIKIEIRNTFDVNFSPPKSDTLIVYKNGEKTYSTGVYLSELFKSIKEWKEKSKLDNLESIL